MTNLKISTFKKDEETSVTKILPVIQVDNSEKQPVIDVDISEKQEFLNFLNMKTTETKK